MNTKFLTIKSKLVKLLSTAMLPMIFFSACVVGYVTYQRQAALDKSLNGTTNAISDTLKSELNSIQSHLALLVAIEDFTPERMPDLHRRLQRFVAKQKDWSSVSLSGLDGKQIISSMAPYGADLPSWADQKFFTETLKTQKPVVSGFRIGRVTHKKNFSISYPVKKNGKLEYVLVATVNLTFLKEILERQGLPKNWTATILDQDGIILARSINHEERAGIKATPRLIESLKRSEPFFTRINHEGIVQYSTYNDLPNGWKVYLGMPSLERQIPMSDVVIFLITGGLALFSVGLYFSLVISRRISRPIIELAESARAIGKGEKPKHVETNIFEVNEVNDALINAAHERDLADEKARIAIELRDNFLSIASHELKTPLTSMNLQSQIISKMIENPDRMSLEKLHKSVTTINSQMKRLTRLIDDLLDISRITAGKLDINKERLDLSLLTKEIVSYFEGVSKTSKITFIDSSVEGNFDRNRMEQVITNLVSNAIKYGDGNPISVEVSREQDFAVVKVKDNGIGIDPKDQNRIFERFERLVSNNDVSGLGLGLWIVHKIITQLEGKISVHSEGLGKGTTFTVKVPIN